MREEYLMIYLILDLFAKYSNIDISSMGFPKNWKELLNSKDCDTGIDR